MRTCSYCDQDLDTITLHEHVITCKTMEEITTEQLREIFYE